MASALIVDDSPDLRRLLSRALTNEGHTVFTADDGRQAQEVINQIGEPCVVLLDLMMPVMDGFQFLEWKNSQPNLASCPVVILSASTYTDLPKGAVAMLKKPVDLDELLDLVEANAK